MVLSNFENWMIFIRRSCKFFEGKLKGVFLVIF
jgi:hypothetical protein